MFKESLKKYVTFKKFEAKVKFPIMFYNIHIMFNNKCVEYFLIRFIPNLITCFHNIL